MYLTTTRGRAALVAAPMLLAMTAGGLTSPAKADESSDAPLITRVTTSNESGGLSPHVHLYSVGFVEFTDATPSPTESYRVVVDGEAGEQWIDDWRVEGGFAGSFDVYSLEHGQSYTFTVEELDADGQVTATSDPVEWTFRYVKHPRDFSTNSKKVKGQWSYRAGRKAKFEFKGKWEAGTRFKTQVWVSKRKRFTADDFDRNFYGNAALVDTGLRAEPVMSVKIPRKLVGKYVWVSILGWKDGTAGWRYTVPAEKVIR